MHIQFLDYVQLGGKEAGRVIFVAQYIVALVDGVEEQERVSDAEQRGEASRDQPSRRRPRTLLYPLAQLLNQLLLAALYVILETQMHFLFPNGRKRRSKNNTK
jgi:hypothetical protein